MLLPQGATRSLRAEFPAIVALLLPLGVLLRGLFLPGAILWGSDTGYYFYPLTMTGMVQWRAGSVPLWTAGIQSGFPLLADGQGSPLYPLTLLTNLLLPGPMAINAGALIETVLAALFMYAFVRALGLARLPAVLAAWVYVLAGPVIPAMGSPRLHAFVWWPLLFLLAEHMARHNSLTLAGVASLIMGTAWLGGFPQTAFYGVLAASAYLAFRSLTNGAWQVALRAMVLWAGSVMLGIGIGAVQLLPTLEMAASSIRAGGVDYALSLQESLLPTAFAGFILPNWKRIDVGGIAGPNLYLGVIGLAVTFLAHPWRSGRPAWFFWGLAGAGCLLSVARFNPVYWIIYRLPGQSFLRGPARFLDWTMFSLAVLLAMGIQQILEAQDIHLQIGRRLLRYLSLLLGLALACSIGGTLLLRVLRGPLLNLASAYTQRYLLGQAYRVQGQQYYQARVQAIYDWIRAALDPLAPGMVALILLSLAAIGLLLLWLRRAQRMRRAPLALIALAAIDLWLPSVLHPLQLASTSVLNPPSLASLTNAQSGQGRLYELVTQADIIAGSTNETHLSPNYNLLAGIAHVGVYGALGSRRYYDLLGNLGDVNLGFGLRPGSADDLMQNRPLLNLLNVRYLISNDPLNLPGLSMIQSGSPWLYANLDALPRAMIVPAAVITSASGVLSIMHSPSFDPQAAVLLESTPPIDISGGISSTPAIVESGDEHIVLDAEGPGWLLLADINYPGWQVHVDGQPERIYTADYVLRAVPLPEGRHRVEFDYRPASFLWGLSIAGCSVLIAALLVGVSLAHSANRHSGRTG